MDEKTVSAYDASSAQYARRHHGEEPGRLWDLIRIYFHSGAATADIGCGSGRDTAWLKRAGFRVRGFDASRGILAQARALHPELELELERGTLPDLDGVASNSFNNVLASAVLMHLPPDELITACVNLLRITRDGGRLIVTFRLSRETGEREADQRLYAPIHPGKLAFLFESLGAAVLLREGECPWSVLVIEKAGEEQAGGLRRIQEILVQDRKTATYKPALIRALCALSQFESHLVIWDPIHHRVLVPAKRVGGRTRNWEKAAIAGLIEAAERVTYSRGLERWDGVEYL